MITTGTTATGTSGSGVVALLTTAAGKPCNGGTIINEGAAPGFYRVDGGPWSRIPAGPTAVSIAQAFELLEMQRDGSTDMTGVYATGY